MGWAFSVCVRTSEFLSRAFSPLRVGRLCPGAVPQARVDRAVGAEVPSFSHRLFQPCANPKRQKHRLFGRTVKSHALPMQPVIFSLLFFFL